MNAATPRHRIGQAAALSGVSTASIRFYEQQGLLAPGVRAANSYRAYTDGDVHQLRFIRLCRAMDMSLDEVRTLLNLDLAQPADCVAADAALESHIAHVAVRLAELQALQRDLQHLRAGCDGSGTPCRIMQTLHARAERLPPGVPKGRVHTHV